MNYFPANDDRQVIQQNLMAIAEMARLRAHSLEMLDQSRQLLRMIDNMNAPLIRAPEDGAGRLDSPGLAGEVNDRITLARRWHSE